jgi:GAF domain-containing protein
MAEEIALNKELSDKDIYSGLIPQIKSLLSKEDNLVSNLANFTAAIKEAFNKVSWAGFYLVSGDHLFLGPFQGKVACTKIPFGKGVCGQCASLHETIIVPDVNLFPDHIVCDSGSKSEIVVPVFLNGDIWGVLDLDSYELDAFNLTDKTNLEALCEYLSSEIIF